MRMMAMMVLSYVSAKRYVTAKPIEGEIYAR